MSRPKKKKRKTMTIPTTSMGDIAFLLIIFFLVCSEAVKDNSKLPVTLPLSEHVKKTKATVVAYVVVDEKGQIYFDNSPVDSAKDVEFSLRAILTNTVSDDQRHVQFKCDQSQSKEVFQPVLQAIAEAGGIIEAVGEIEK
jgi:biopolymer transport protein ExbD